MPLETQTQYNGAKESIFRQEIGTEWAKWRCKTHALITEKNQMQNQMQTAPHKVTTRLNSFHDNFCRVLRPLFWKTQNFNKIEKFHAMT